MGLLTDIQIKHWVRAGAPVAKSDGDGLTFTLSGNGTASWVLRYRHGGKQREKTIGRFPDISLRKARELAAADRARIQQGIDVGREKQQEKHDQIRAITVKQLVTDYEEKVLPGLASSTGVSRRQKIRSYILPAIGHLLVRDVTGSDAVDLLERVNAKYPKQVKEVLSVVNTIFAHAQAKKVVDVSPSAGIAHKAISGVAGTPDRTRIMLSDAEIKALLPALSNASRPVEFAVRVLLSTAVRVQALTLAEWSHIDFEKREWLIPAGEGRKSSRDFILPLTTPVVGYFQALKKIAGKSLYVLPVTIKRREGAYPMPPGSINHAIDKVCAGLGQNIRPFSPHDLRSTARSHFAALGVPIVVAERCLNHNLGGLVAVYDQHDYLDERRKALELWSAKLELLEQPAENVVVLNQVA